MLPRARRLVREQDFRRIYHKGVSYFAPGVVLKTLPTQGLTKIGFVVSQKVSKKATIRNAIKRQLREFLRLRLENIGEGKDCVFIVRAGYNVDKISENYRNIDLLLKRAGLYIKK